MSKKNAIGGLKAFAIGVTLVAMSGVAFTACGGGGGGGGGGPYYQPWYDVYGNYCGSGDPTPGCNFYADGIKVHDLNDPYYAGGAGVYYEYGLWTFTDSYGFAASYDGWAWLSPSGILYNDIGQALNENAEESSRDIIEDTAKQEEKVVLAAGEGFASRFALQSETGVDVARTLNAWATLTRDRKSRVRTEKDIADFSKRLFGIEVSQAKVALGLAKEGDLSRAKELNAQIANHWGTSPETSAQILKTWYKNQF